MSEIMLCADSASLQNPELLGLDGVSLDALSWLKPFSAASEARAYARGSRSASEVWVVSSDDMEGINLAAALKRDRIALPVFLVLFETSGSALSRAKSAGLNGTLSKNEFLRRFADGKKRSIEPSLSEDAAEFDDLWGDGEWSDDLELASGQEGALKDSSNESSAPSSMMPAFAPEAALPCAPELVLEPIVSQSPAPATNAFVLTVVSGSGGAGKSVATAVLASLAAQRGLRVLALDCDLQFGDLHDLLGIKAPTTIDDALADPRLLGALCESKENLVLLAAPSRLEYAEVVTPSLPWLIDGASPFFDVIVVNTGANWVEGHAVLLERSACTLCLVDQRASSVRACKHALDLCARCGIATGAFLFAVNRCARGALFTSVDVSCALKGAHVIELKDGGAAVEELLGAGLMGELLASKNDFCESASKVLDEVLPSVNAPLEVGSRAAHEKSRRVLFEGGLFAGAGKASRRRGKRETLGSADERRSSKGEGSLGAAMAPSDGKKVPS